MVEIQMLNFRQIMSNFEGKFVEKFKRSYKKKDGFCKSKAGRFSFPVLQNQSLLLSYALILI